jgi:hypothetical protein
LGTPAGLAAGIGVAAALVAGLAYAGSRRRVEQLQAGFPLPADSLAEAGRLLDATGRPGDSPGATADSRAMQRLNRARALTFAAMREGDHDRLMEALPLLRQVISDQTLDHRADYQAFLEQSASEDAVAAADDEAAGEQAFARAVAAHHAVNRELTAALELTGPER